MSLPAGVAELGVGGLVAIMLSREVFGFVAKRRNGNGNDKNVTNGHFTKMMIEHCASTEASQKATNTILGKIEDALDRNTAATNEVRITLAGMRKD